MKRYFNDFSIYGIQGGIIFLRQAIYSERIVHGICDMVSDMVSHIAILNDLNLLQVCANDLRTPAR